MWRAGLVVLIDGKIIEGFGGKTGVKGQLAGRVGMGKRGVNSS
jgi:predicted butyrate kinase (DUF1464 family)